MGLLLTHARAYAVTLAHTNIRAHARMGERTHILAHEPDGKLLSAEEAPAKVRATHRDNAAHADAKGESGTRLAAPRQ